MYFLVYLFSLYFAVDTALLLLHFISQSSFFSDPLSLADLLLFIVSMPMTFLVMIYPKAKVRIFLPPLIFVLGFIGLWVPFTVLADSIPKRSLSPLVQFAVYVLFQLQVYKETGKYFFPRDYFQGSYSFGRFMKFSAAGGLSMPVLMASILWFSAGRALDQFTSGFVDLNWSGITTLSKTYEKQGQRIHLLAMAHIGEPQFYQEVLAHISHDNEIILLEGVSNRKNTLPDGFGYGGVADSLGLVSQYAFQEELKRRNSVNADLDLADFSPKTIKLLKSLAPLFENRDWRKMLGVSLTTDIVVTREDKERFFDDLIDKRNQNLLNHIQESQTQYKNIYVPWGAAHLPGIEQAVLAMNYQLEGYKTIYLIRFW